MLVRKTVLVRKMVLNRKNWKQVGGLRFPKSMPLAGSRQKEAVSDTVRVQVVCFFPRPLSQMRFCELQIIRKHSMLLVEMTVTVLMTPYC